MMEYMESKMQDYMEAGMIRMEELSEQRERFEQFYLSLPDLDETLLKDVDEGAGLSYTNETVQFMWACFKAGAGVY